MGPDLSELDADETPTSALAEVSPGTALVFGVVPDSLKLIPFSLVSPEDREAIVSAVASVSSVFNVGGQVLNALAQAQGLVRLAPETIQALQAGATAVKSGGYYIGTLSQAGKFSNSVRWLPATGATAAGVIASLGPAIAMIAIQIQLSELSGLVRENLALTETVLKAVRHEQWAEVAGLEQAVAKAVEEANTVGRVTPLIWENISGHEAELRKQRDLFRRNVAAHAAELAARKGHKERRQYIEKSGEALLLDLHCLLLAHKAWFEYQALRAGRARLGVNVAPDEAKLAGIILENAKAEFENTTAQMAAILDTVNRELWILAELPGRRTIAFTGARRSAKDVARMSDQLFRAVQRVSPAVSELPMAVEPPQRIFVDEPLQISEDLRVLRWHLRAEERLEVVATARAAGMGALEGFGLAVKGLGDAITQSPSAVRRALDEPDAPILIAITQNRVLIADLNEFRHEGIVRRTVPSEDIRLVRFRRAGALDRAEIDLLTSETDETWRFNRGTLSSAQAGEIAEMLEHRARANSVRPQAELLSE